MRSVLPVAVVLLFAAGFQACAPAVDPGPTLDELRAEVQVRSLAVVAAEKAKDFELAVTFFTEDAVIQPPNAPQIQGREALLALYEAGFSTMVDFKGTITAIVPAVSGDIAYEYGVNWLQFETPDGLVEDLGKYLLVWTKVEDVWLIDALAFSSDAPVGG